MQSGFVAAGCGWHARTQVHALIQPARQEDCYLPNTLAAASAAWVSSTIGFSSISITCALLGTGLLAFDAGFRVTPLPSSQARKTRSTWIERAPRHGP